jgi:hypothetical protein
VKCHAETPLNNEHAPNSEGPGRRTGLVRGQAALLYFSLGQDCPPIPMCQNVGFSLAVLGSGGTFKTGPGGKSLGH